MSNASPGSVWNAIYREELANPANMNPNTGHTLPHLALAATNARCWATPPVRMEYTNVAKGAEGYDKQHKSSFHANEHVMIFDGIKAAMNDSLDILNIKGHVTQQESDDIYAGRLTPVRYRWCLIEPPPKKQPDGTFVRHSGPYPIKMFYLLSDSEMGRWLNTRGVGVGHDLNNLRAGNWLHQEVKSRPHSPVTPLYQILNF